MGMTTRRFDQGWWWHVEPATDFRPMSDEQRRARAARRREEALIVRTTLQPRERDLSPVRAEEAISLVTRLTLEAWSLSGRSLPQYARGDVPIRFVALPPR